MLQAIIKSLLDTDAYTFTVMQVAFHQFISTTVEYAFKCRNVAYWTPEFLKRLNEEIDSFCNLTFTEEELVSLKKKMPYLKDDFIDFLRIFRPNRSHINAQIVDGELKISVKGPWYLTVMFEVPVLAMVNEIYFSDKLRNTDRFIMYADGMKRLDKKLEIAKEAGFPFAELGTRRRFSAEWQDIIIPALKKLPGFVGTSNVYLAVKHNIKAIGTMSHQYIMAGAGQPDIRLSGSQAHMLQCWAGEYRGEVGIALTDTYGINAFLRDFDLYFAKLYDGLRHDSGCPFDWTDKVLKHYCKLGIDALTKTLIYSDGLNMEKAAEIWNRFKKFVKICFGIGTNLTNDFEGIIPLQIVMKIIYCNNHPVAKIPDTKGKGMCPDPGFEVYARSVFHK